MTDGTHAGPFSWTCIYHSPGVNDRGIEPAEFRWVSHWVRDAGM